MRKRGLGAIVGCVAALSLLAAQPAGAATQVGNGCVANKLAPGFTLVGLANHAGNPFPAAVPSNGVITKWTINFPPGFPPIPVLSTSLKVLRPTGPGQLLVTAESTAVPTGGAQTFPARIPVQAGDLLGTATYETEDPANQLALYCETKLPGDLLGAVAGNPPVGATAVVFDQEPGLQNPVSANVEPDADGDGFGDETQDGCPQAAVAQGPCPPVAVDASSVIKRKGSVVVLVTTDSPAPVTVAGTANLGKGKKAKLRSKAQTVVPGKVTKFTLKFPRKLKERLGDLARKRKLGLKITVSATDLIGRVTTDTLKTKLKGQAK